MSERHELVGRGDERVRDYQFVMRCWEREELGMLFARHGFNNIQYFGAYDHSVELAATDRLVAVAQLRTVRTNHEPWSARLARGNNASKSDRCVRAWAHTGAGFGFASLGGQEPWTPHASPTQAVTHS